MTDDSALVLQHLVGESAAKPEQHGDLYRASQPLHLPPYASSGKPSASELGEHSDAETPTPSLSVLSRQASSSSIPSTGSSHGSEASAEAPQPTPGGHSDHAAAPPPMSSTRMAGMQAALAVQAKHQTDLPESLEYDLLIGADGANSQVRPRSHQHTVTMHADCLATPGQTMICARGVTRPTAVVVARCVAGLALRARMHVAVFRPCAGPAGSGTSREA